MDLTEDETNLLNQNTTMSISPLKYRGEVRSMVNDELPITFTMVEDTWDNAITKVYDWQWVDVVEALSEHLITLNKHETMMIIPATFKDISDEYEPALFGRKHPMEGQIKFREDGHPHIRRCKANVRQVYMLPLDMDGGMSIEEAKVRFAEYEYLAYTSFGHKTKEKNYKDAFRIFLPFSKPITGKQYELRQDAFREWLGTELDQSSADVARGFYIPSYTRENMKNGHCTWRNEGVLLDPMSFKEREEIIFEPKPIQVGLKGDDIPGKILWDTLDAVGLFRALGLYKHSCGGSKHEIICPWHNQHTSSPDTGTCMYERSGNRKAAFVCRHSGCKDNRMFQVTRWVKTKHSMDFLRQFYEILPTDKQKQDKMNEIDSDLNIIAKRLEQLKKEK